MKRYNILYIVGGLMAILLLFLGNNMKSESAFFYGFAENKHTEINHIQDVQVNKIHVTNGQQVKKGDLLIELLDNNLSYKIDGLKLEKESVTANQRNEYTKLQVEIEELIAKRNLEIADVSGRIVELEKSIAINKSLYEGLKTIQKRNKEYTSLESEKLIFFKERLNKLTQNRDSEVAQKKRILNTLSSPSKIKRDIIDSEISQYDDVQQRLSIYAPFDGLVGLIQCKEGENISAFTSLMDLYKHNPTQVRGYVHESMILKVQVGDKLEVASTLHPDVNVEGEVIGLGSRIIEIPERLRKMPEVRTYGREVLIEIPSENQFLQKEKVMLNVFQKSKNVIFGNLFSSNQDSRTVNRGYSSSN